jgi:DNA polymerase III alpha subunit
MVHPYLRRRAGEEKVEYPSEEVRQVLERTLGVPIFQEQVMQLAIVAAGFTPGEADQLRRAMAAWRVAAVSACSSERLIDGMRQRGYSQRSRSASSTRSRDSANMAFPNRMPRASRCWFTFRRGSSAMSRPLFSARC